MHKIKIVNTIKELKKEEWDAMIGDSVFASYGWLKTVEETYIGNLNPKYIIVLDSSRIIGASICYLITKTDESVDIDNLLLGRLKKFTSKLGISFLPTFLCGPMRCYGKHLLIAKEADSKYKEIIADDLFTAIEKEASYHGLSVCFYNVMDDEVELIQLLKERRYNGTLGYPLNYLDIEWSSFDGYKDYVKRNNRKKGYVKKVINYEINKNRKEGVVIKKLATPDEYEDRLLELVNYNSYKYSSTPFSFKKEFFKRLKDNLGEDVVFYASFKKGIMTGMSILLKRSRTGYLPIIGIDHEKTGNDFTYFNIGLYRPIMDAISGQMSRLYYGNAMYDLKAKRGCKISNTYVYYKPYREISKITIMPWFAFHALWFRKKLYKNIVKRKES
ncbi:MAG: peptidogalycan biosysnthesis protein [Candidatus Anammoxibacter sp.]